MKKQVLLCLVVLAMCFVSCRSSHTVEVIKPRTHRTWYKSHVYKKKWHLGRLHFRFEKQGTRKVKMKS